MLLLVNLANSILVYFVMVGLGSKNYIGATVTGILSIFLGIGITGLLARCLSERAVAFIFGVSWAYVILRYLTSKMS